MYRRGELKSLVSAIEAQTGDNIVERDRMIDKNITALMESGKMSENELDFNKVAAEFVTEEARDLKHILEEMGQDMGCRFIAEAMGASAFPQLTKTVIGNATIKAYNIAVGDTAELVTEVPARSTSEDVIPGFTEAGNFEKREESMRYEEKHFGEKRTSVTLSDFGNMFALTAEAIYEDRLGLLPGWARNTGRKGGAHRAKMIIQTIEMQPRTAFGEDATNLRAHVAKGTVITAANHYNTDHSAVTGLDGQTNANIESTATDTDEISTDGVAAVLDLFSSMVDEKGDAIEVNPTHLLVPLKLKPKAWQLLVSSGEFDTANRADNYFKGMFKPVSSRFLNTNYYYYLGDFASQILWAWVFKPTTEMAVSTRDEAFANKVIWRIKHAYHGGCAHSNYVNIARGGSTA